MIIDNEKILWEQLIYETLHEINIVTERVETERGTSGLIIFGEKDLEATQLYIWHLIWTGK